jgi:cobyrinic acid a,c-diamide synthase
MAERTITMTEAKVKSIVVAGLSGGSGKSIVAVGLCAAWVQQGAVVAPFKKGPDYIDAGWLQRAAARPCYNLDPFLFAEETIRASFMNRSTGADFAVVEGNRGLFDGVTATGGYSTAELAVQLDLPVLLVVNCTKMTRTVAALVQGCIIFEPQLRIGGVILNQVATKRQQNIITEAIHHYTDVRVLGAVPRLQRDVFPMRHLGMIPYQEYDDTAQALELLAETVTEHIDLAALEAVMKPVERSALVSQERAENIRGAAEVRIGVIQDSAFQFYYPENLEAIEKQGGRLISINALEDQELPALDGLYIGGGFPETSAARLAANHGFRRSVKRAASAGLPIYAECGGLIYLGREIIIGDQRYPLAGVFDVVFSMSEKPQAHGYSIFTVEKANPFFPVGFSARGHEFRYSTIMEWSGSSDDLALKMERGTGFQNKSDGLSVNNVLALYTHLHAEGTPQWAGWFVQRCRRYRQEMKNCSG